MLIKTRDDFSSGLDYWPPDVKESRILNPSDIPGLFRQASRTLNKSPNCNRTQQTREGKGCKVARRMKWSEGLRIKHLHWTRRSRRDQGGAYRTPYKYTRDRLNFSTLHPHSQPRSSLASTRVHLEACDPPHRRSHKVREA